MHHEVKAASVFLGGLPKQGSITQDQRKIFQDTLAELMASKFNTHWNLENPLQGNGYRSIIIGDQKVDPLITEAARKANILNIADLLPAELYLWVDPFDVCCKYGEYTPISAVWKAENPNAGQKVHNLHQEKVSYVLTVS